MNTKFKIFLIRKGYSGSLNTMLRMYAIEKKTSVSKVFKTLYNNLKTGL